jgi:NAD(P)-dependent dehydrogenase (short-subunit alcohol dehydrogenase family)
MTKMTGKEVDMITNKRVAFITGANRGIGLETTRELVKCNSYIAFAVHGSRASPRTACALTVHPELVEGFFELKRESTVTVY